MARKRHSDEDILRLLREIASSRGYSDTTPLSRLFKGWTGQTPIAIRKQYSLLDDG